jgi:dTDP-4-amino-4,6-dideoxygalactose transaminase
MKPKLGTYDEMEPYLRRIDLNNIYSNHGPLVFELEETYAKYFGVKSDLVVAIANATQAIQGLVSLSSIENWIVPNYTFPATALAVLNARKNIYICDVSETDWKLRVDLIDKSLTNFGIVPVMPFGSKVEFEPYKEFDKVIIDAAASLGSNPPPFNEMQADWAVVYSLHATKVLGAGEGGIVVCGSIKLAQSLRSWINFGFVGQKHTSAIQGTNAKMSEISAAYALHSINNFEVERNEWLHSQSYVALITKDCRWRTFVNNLTSFHPYWIASFRNKNEKIMVSKYLLSKGIQSRSWWNLPISSQKPFSNSPIFNEISTANKLSEKHLGLPMFRGLSHESILEICEHINNISEKNKYK